MDFSYNQKQLQFQQKAREFIEKEMAPKIEEYDRRSIFAKEAFLKFGEQGFLGVIVPQEFGGLALGTMEYCLLSEELGRLSAGYHHNGIFQTQKMIMNYGTQEQKKRFLPGLASGKFHAATAISEPAAGSSFAKIKTFARNIKDN